MKYEICSGIFGDEDLATTAASLAKVVFDDVLPAAYPVSTLEAGPGSAFLDAGHRLLLVSQP